LHLSVRGLCKSFGDFRALSDIDLDVIEGEFVCFLGPSGCGKTTLLRIIAGLTRQDSGRITQGRPRDLRPRGLEARLSASCSSRTRCFRT
jgi:iron(III) transport system ATP-binding protein